MTNKIYQNDTGLKISVPVGVSTSGASVTTLEVTKPDCTIVTWLADKKDDTTLSYVTAVGDLDQAGNYLIQAIVGWGETDTHRGETAKLKVYEKFK
jgi:hypothetical protein